MGLIHPYQFTTHILKTATTGEDFCATVVSISGTGTTADRNGLLSVAVTVTISPQLNLNFLKFYSPSNVSFKWMRILSLKVQFLLSILVSRTSIRLSSNFFRVFWLLKC